MCDSMMQEDLLVGYPVDGLPVARRRWAVFAAMLALFMAVLDINVVNVVLPDLAVKFAVSDSTIIWVVNIYQLAIVTTLLSFSFLGDIFGYNRVFLAGVAVFVVGSLLTALSGSFAFLVFARFVQGIGASAITSVNQAQLRTLYPRRLIGQGLALNAMVVAVSAAAGPSIAGVVLSLLSWHWLFAVNVPIGLLAVLMGLRYLPRLNQRRAIPFDRRSAILNALSFGLMVYLFEHIAHGGNVWVAIVLCVLLVLVGSLYVRRERLKTVPMLPLDLMRIPIFRLSIFTSVCSFVACMLALVSLPFFLQNRHGFSAIETGLLLTPWPLATIMVAPVAGRLVTRVHPGYLGALGMLLFAAGLVSLYLLPHEVEAWSLVWRLALCGAGFALFQTPNNTTIMSSGPKQRSGGASGMLGMARLTGQTLGATMVALAFHYVPEAWQFAGCFLIAALFALVAALFSISRLGYQLHLTA